MAAIRSLTDVTADLLGKVAKALGAYGANRDNKPSNVFVSEARNLEQTAMRISQITQEAITEINNIMITESADFRDSVNIGMTALLEKLRDFYFGIADNKGMLIPEKEFSNKRILEPFETLNRRAGQLTGMYAS